MPYNGVMPSQPMEHLSQRRLVYELRIAIDAARNAQTSTALNRAIREVRTLVEQNPRSVDSKYTQHNLGAARRTWLREARDRG